MDELFVVFVVILLPGIFAVLITDLITVHSKWGAFEIGLYSLILGISAYALLQLVYWLVDLIIFIFISGSLNWSQLKIWEVALNKGKGLQGSEVVWATFLTVPVALAASWLVNYKIINKITQYLKLTNKFGDENLYSYYLNAKEIDWVYVREREANLTYQGRIMALSENENMQELVLIEVSVFRYEDSEHLYDVPSLYLSRSLGSLTIEAIPLDLLKEKNDEQEETIE